jgi:hypothetical protein
MKKIIFWLSVILIISCRENNSISELYLKFINDPKNDNFYQLGTRLKVPYSFDNLVKLDTSLLQPLNLIDTTSKSEDYGIVNLQDYNCRLLGIYKNQKFDCIITSSNTTAAGDGNPIIHISTYSKNGNPISDVKFFTTWQHDYTPIPEQFFTLDDKNNLTFELIEKNFEIVDSLGTEVLKYINTTNSNQYYLIEENGLFKTVTK